MMLERYPIRLRLRDRAVLLVGARVRVVAMKGKLAEGALFTACRVPDEAQIGALIRATLATSLLETP